VTEPSPNADTGARYDDGILRAIHRIAVSHPTDPWPADVVANLIDEIIRHRGTDKTWLALNPPPNGRDGTDS
jgi:hypothetical protein